MSGRMPCMYVSGLYATYIQGFRYYESTRLFFGSDLSRPQPWPWVRKGQPPRRYAEGFLIDYICLSLRESVHIYCPFLGRVYLWTVSHPRMIELSWSPFGPIRLKCLTALHWEVSMQRLRGLKTDKAEWTWIKQSSALKWTLVVMYCRMPCMFVSVIRHLYTRLPLLGCPRGYSSRFAEGLHTQKRHVPLSPWACE